MRRLVCLLLALALALPLCGCGGGESTAGPGPQAVTTLWLWSELPTADALAALVDDYNAENPASPVALRVFDSESALGAALNDARPDLLLCAGERAFALYALGRLREAAPEAALAGAWSELDDSVGRGFFPLGGETTLLAVNAAAYLASPVTSGAGDAALGRLESLCSLAAAHGRSTGQPFLAAESWAALFETALLQRGERFTPDFDALRESGEAAALYNLLAEAAFARGLYAGGEDAATLVRRGYVTCALLPSRAIAADPAGLACYPAPLREDGEALAFARVWGLAVTAGEGTELAGAEAFLSWLLRPEIAGALALDEGLLPCVPPGADEAAPGSLEQALLRTLETCRFRPAPETDEHALRAADFDERLRAALALLE